MKLATHSGPFHADDVFACALLRTFLEEDIEVLRTRDLDEIAIGDDVYQFRQQGVRVYRRDPRGGWRIDRETWSPEPTAVRGYAHVETTCARRVC